MNIGIDLRCLPSDGSAGAGVAHASRALSEALVHESREDLQWTIFLPAAAPWTSGGNVVGLRSTSGGALREALRRYPCDLLFVPSGAVAPGVKIPTVPWVHDLDIFDHPEWFAESPLRRAVSTRLFLNGLRRSHQICAVSEYAKGSVIRHVLAHADDITVTHEGGDDVLSTMHGPPLHDAKTRAKCRVAQQGVSNPFILFLGTLEPRKHLTLLLEAWLLARHRFSRPVDLVIAGRDGWKLAPIHHAVKCAQAYAAEGDCRIHRVSALSDEDRRDLLLAASLVAIPSQSEGFGLVALEAMQAGTAVVASRVGGLSEVLGEHGCLLPPTDLAMWTQALVHLMNDAESRQHVADQGKSRSQQMTWERCAEVVFDVLTKTPHSRIVSTRS
jgi:glycosyltransferase involved in cell wall biosynthesis